jgi:hypothetical protein
VEYYLLGEELARPVAQRSREPNRMPGRWGRCCVCFGDVRQDEPHRVYLVQFPALGVLKVGIRNSKNDHRIEDHAAASGVLLDVIDTNDRAGA